MKFPKEWIDQNGYVMPQPNSDHSDNGALFTSVAILMGFEFPEYEKLIEDSFLEPGLLPRWKGNDYDQMAWDCYLGVAAACIRLGNKRIPRQILSYGLRNAFVFNTDKKLERKDWLGRNIPIWPLMFCAAFPNVRFLMYPALWFVQLFFEDTKKMLDRNYTNGIQLQWVFLIACYNMGFKFERSFEHDAIIDRAFAIYYHKDHPFNNLEIL